MQPDRVVQAGDDTLALGYDPVSGRYGWWVVLHVGNTETNRTWYVKALEFEVIAPTPNREAAPDVGVEEGDD